MNLINGMPWRRILAGASAGLFVLSSTAFAASRVSPPPRPNAGKQIVRPGETVEAMKRSARAHSNKLRNKVTPERAMAASVEKAMPPGPQPIPFSQQASKPELDLAAANASRQQD